MIETARSISVKKMILILCLPFTGAQNARRKRDTRGQGPDRTLVHLYCVLEGTRRKTPFFLADTALSQDTGLREQSGVNFSSSLSPGLYTGPEVHALLWITGSGDQLSQHDLANVETRNRLVVLHACVYVCMSV